MDVRKCDRCGKQYEKRKLVDLETGAMIGGNWYDLCEDCMKELLAFLDNPQSTKEKLAEPSADGDVKEKLEAAIADQESACASLSAYAALRRNLYEILG